MKTSRRLHRSLKGLAVALAFLSGTAFANTVWVAGDKLVEIDIARDKVLRSYAVNAITFDVDTARNAAWYTDGERLAAVRKGRTIVAPVDVKGPAGIQVSSVVVDSLRGHIWTVRGNEVSVFDRSGRELNWWDLTSPYGNNTHVVKLEIDPDTGFAWIAQPNRLMFLRADRPWQYGRLWSTWYEIKDISLVANGIWVQRHSPEPFETLLELHAFDAEDGVIEEITHYRQVRTMFDPTGICADDTGVWVLMGYDDLGGDTLGAFRMEAGNPGLWQTAAPDTGYEADLPAVTDVDCARKDAPWLSWNATVAEFGDSQWGDGIVTRRFFGDGNVRKFRVVAH